MAEPPRFVKARDYRGACGWRLWKRLRASKPAREYQRYQIMKSLGIPCPGNIAYEDQRNIFGLLVHASLTMDKLENATDLRYFFCLDEYAKLRADRAFRLDVARELAGWVKLMHDRKFYHLNLNFRNIMLKVDPPRPAGIYFIDCTGGRFGRFGPRRRHLRKKELAFIYKDARSWCSLKEMAVFMHVYLGTKKLSVSDRRLMRQIVRYAEHKWGDSSSTIDD